MSSKPAKVPPARLVRIIDSARNALHTVTRAMVPGNIALLETAQGAWVSQALYVAAKLGIADELANGPKTAEQVAAKVGAHPDSVFRLMRMLAGRSVFNHRADGRFELAAMGQALRADVPGSMRSMVLFIGSPEHWAEWGELLYSVQTGRPSPEKLYGKSYFDHLDEAPEQAAIFNDAMSTMAAMANDLVIPAYDFSEFRLIADIGGGHGRLLSAILQSAPAARGILFDLPSVIAGAAQVLDEAGVSDRCVVEGGSFMDSVPDGADAYVLKSIIHDWDDDISEKILRNVRTSIARNGRLLLLEIVLPERATANWGAVLDMEMLVSPGGRERTRAEFADLLARSGFRLTRVIDTATPMMSIVEAVPA
ncbi:hydroxyneurosporene methyltransferase [Mycolicibacterium moriokaense]|uniref:Hydroxyneurosporene-O-methyltransferase n=1 Tax=Mycolicibacterium moriokaense TaxID=39691 RepID=A0AAD1HFH1_9MYCO|nr:methyltransferase [Mycolicibacterium moriokaense]MCV7038102.1 hydroxyneurosporene methyltransferase [Mycolicibacterium moriokaense]ORB19232.1 hydroxyneurosporene methyltransferase [Mycolicibacterium moriokaense]BBX03068.1 hydroxyneurosporene-O-methyltransferase [Mycolicibacterium moriokaense]